MNKTMIGLSSCGKELNEELFKSYSENGISRMYENADVPDSMLSDVISHCGLV